jgi:hypothetical protein
MIDNDVRLAALAASAALVLSGLVTARPAIRTLDPADEDFSDLQATGRAIGDSGHGGRYLDRAALDALLATTVQPSPGR